MTLGRIPISMSGFDTTDPRDKAILDFARQPAMGCQYVDTSNTYTTCPDNTPTTLNILATVGDIIYDPYNMIDVANDRIRIPTPGIWDIYAEVQGIMASNGSPTFSAVTEGLATPDLARPMTDAIWTTVATGAFKHNLGMYPLLVDQAWIETKTYLYVRVLNNDIIGVADASAKITTFSAHLRSAYPPSRF